MNEFGDPVAEETFRSGWSRPCIGICHVFGGKFLHFWSSGVCCTCHSQVEVISLCHQHCSLAEGWPSTLILFHSGKNHLCMSLSYWAGDYRRVQFHQHEMSFGWYPSITQGISSIFHSITVFGIYNGTLFWNSLVYWVVSFLETVDPADWNPKNGDT